MGDAAPANPRVIVLTDIEADPDDTQSLVRLLLYSNVIDIEGLIATTSVHQKTRIAPEAIRAVVEAYGEVQPSLLRHEPGFPDAAMLAELIRSGAAVYGMDGVGDGQRSEGSDWIIRVLERDDPRPLWVSIWGGPNTLAQALDEICRTRSAAEAARLIGKLRVYAISDQDDSAAWIRREFPDLFYIVSPGGFDRSTWAAITKPFPGSEAEFSPAWISANIQTGHGPLGAQYPDTLYGMEGDTPAFLGLVPNGLNVPEQPDWGGWGGRYELQTPSRNSIDANGYTAGVPVFDETRPIWTDTADRLVAEGGKIFNDNRATLWRWRKDFQNDFAARMDWTTKDYAEANHPPVPVVDSPPAMTVRSGAEFRLDASSTTDPDGDQLTFEWFNYVEPGTLNEAVVQPAATPRVLITSPHVARAETVHMILRVTDNGAPPLSRYARIVVTIEP